MRHTLTYHDKAGVAQGGDGLVADERGGAHEGRVNVAGTDTSQGVQAGIHAKVAAVHTKQGPAWMGGGI